MPQDIKDTLPEDERGQAQEQEAPAAPDAPPPKKTTASGAYWYVPASGDAIVKNGTIRNLLPIIAVLLHLVVMFVVPSHEGQDYIFAVAPGLTFMYMCSCFAFFGIAIFVIVMDFTRYKLQKRIPVEHAPKNGFKRRAFFGEELFVAINALIWIFELVFLCMYYHGYTLLDFFLYLLALGAAVGGRMLTNLTLKDAELIPPPDNDQKTDA